MDEFNRDLEAGFVVGLKLAATGWLVVLAGCMCASVLGLLIAGPTIANGLTLIWGEE